MYLSCAETICIVLIFLVGFTAGRWYEARNMRDEIGAAYKRAVERYSK